MAEARYVQSFKYNVNFKSAVVKYGNYRALLNYNLNFKSANFVIFINIAKFESLFSRRK